MKIKSLLASALILGATAAAHAANTTTTTFNVTAVVGANCSVSASGISFGTVTPGTASTAMGTVSYVCNSAPSTITLASTNNYTLKGANTSATNFAYTLSQTPTGAPLTNTSGSNSLTGTFAATSGPATSITLYAATTPGSTALADNYSDTITVTLTY